MRNSFNKGNNLEIMEHPPPEDDSFHSPYRGFPLLIDVSISVNFGRHFLFCLSLYLETKMLNSFSDILVI